MGLGLGGGEVSLPWAPGAIPESCMLLPLGAQGGGVQFGTGGAILGILSLAAHIGGDSSWRA